MHSLYIYVFKSTYAFARYNLIFPHLTHHYSNNFPLEFPFFSYLKLSTLSYDKVLSGFMNEKAFSTIVIPAKNVKEIMMGGKKQKDKTEKSIARKIEELAGKREERQWGTVEVGSWIFISRYDWVVLSSKLTY